MSKLSRLEIAVKTVGVTGVLFGALAIAYTVALLYGELPQSKYLMVSGIVFGGLLCYVGYVSLCFRENETAQTIYEHDI